MKQNNDNKQILRDCPIGERQPLAKKMGGTFRRAILPMLWCLIAGLCASCSNEDDVDDIFVGRTWYITGATINGTSIDGDELKELYANPDTYYLNFAVQTFSGRLVAGSTLSGSWTADGKNHTITLQVSQASNTDASVVSRNIYNVLRNAKTYSGDTHYIILYADKQNYVRFYEKNQ